MLKIKSPSKVITAALWFYAERLGIENADARIKLGHIATNDGITAAFVIQPNDNEFEIGICVEAIESGLDFFSTIAHEMIHVHQFIRGDLEDLEDDQIRWKNKIYKDQVIGSRKYYSLPWEKEAFKKQDGLATELFRDRLFLEVLAGV